MRIIPAIDIIGGKCVRLTKGDYSTKKIYNENPLEIAKELEDNGIEYLHLVDLDGAMNKHIVNYKTLAQICSRTNLIVDFGGGVKSAKDLNIAFDCGAQQITVGSIAVTQPATFKSWINKYGPEKIILGADCKDQKIATAGWTKTANIGVTSFIKDYQKQITFQLI